MVSLRPSERSRTRRKGSKFRSTCPLLPLGFSFSSTFGWPVSSCSLTGGLSGVTIKLVGSRARVRIEIKVIKEVYRMTEEDASQPLKLAKAGPGARPLAKDTLTSAIKDVLTETDLSEEKRSRLQERLIKRTEEELENMEGTFREKVEEGSLEEAAKFLIEAPRRLDRALSRLESGELSGPSQSELEELAGRVGAGGPSIGLGLVTAALVGGGAFLLAGDQYGPAYAIFGVSALGFLRLLFS